MKASGQPATRARAHRDALVGAERSSTSTNSVWRASWSRSAFISRTVPCFPLSMSTARPIVEAKDGKVWEEGTEGRGRL